MADFIFTLGNGGDIEYEIEVRGEDAIERALDRIERWPRGDGQELLKFLGGLSTAWIRINAPTGSGGLQRHIDYDPVHWHPGGAGGGGVYETTAGVKRIMSTRIESQIYPYWVHEGTSNRGRAFIYPSDEREEAFGIQRRTPRRRAGGVLTFQKQGEPRKYRWRVKGQKPNPFVYRAYQQVSIYTRIRLQTLGREIVGPGTLRRRARRI